MSKAWRFEQVARKGGLLVWDVMARTCVTNNSRRIQQDGQDPEQNNR
jgi:hypothetical protein